ncbi:hypothetical protein M0R45_022680 [Rubus argutus]|uniref:Uncharacterized protein n=1 Tax=Rubus argutus TaxID=59490 RepID=A0AAW1XF94_RUBAR
MDSEQRRKRKRSGRSYSQANYYLSSPRTLVLCLSFFLFLFLFFLYSGRFRTASFRPVITASSTTLSLISSTASNSVLDSFSHHKDSPPLKVQDRVLFPDHELLIVANRFQQNEQLECVYRRFSNGSDEFGFAVKPVLSTDGYDEFRSIVRCPLPFGNYSSAVDLRRRGGHDDWTARVNSTAAASPWDKVVYEAVIDEDTVVVFAKGLNLRPHIKSDPTRLSCHFGSGVRTKTTALCSLL